MRPAENVENLVLEQIMALRNDVQTFRTEMMHAHEELRTRVGCLESHVSGLRRDLGLLHEDIAAVNARLDRHERRLEVIERRLDLASA